MRGLGGLKRDFCVLVGVHVINNSFKQLLWFLIGFSKFLGIFWYFDTLVTFWQNSQPQTQSSIWWSHFETPNVIFWLQCYPGHILTVTFWLQSPSYIWSHFDTPSQNVTVGRTLTLTLTPTLTLTLATVTFWHFFWTFFASAQKGSRSPRALKLYDLGLGAKINVPYWKKIKNVAKESWGWAFGHILTLLGLGFK